MDDTSESSHISESALASEQVSQRLGQVMLKNNLHGGFSEPAKECPTSLAHCPILPSTMRALNSPALPSGSAGLSDLSQKVTGSPKWSENEDNTLWDLRAKKKSFEASAKHLPGQSEDSCRNRYLRLVKARGEQAMRPANWSAEEDDKLSDLVSRGGQWSWQLRYSIHRNYLAIFRQP
jgi:hypothetical protein